MSLKTIDDDILIPVLEVGDKIYHYTSIEGLRGICEKKFWATERNFLNDYTEFEIATQILCEILDRHMHNKGLCEELKEKLKDEIRRLWENDSSVYACDYVISFSLENDSSLMWSQYSDFMGYCMKFDFDSLLHSFDENEHKILHGKVIYQHEEQIALMEATLKKEFLEWPEYTFINEWSDLDKLSEEEIEILVQFIPVMCSVYNMFFKKECFQGEAEYRFVFMCIHDGGRKDVLHHYDRQNFRIREGCFLPYIERDLKHLDALESILIGPKNTIDLCEKGLKYFLRNNKLEVEVLKSQVPIRY